MTPSGLQPERQSTLRASLVIHIHLTLRNIFCFEFPSRRAAHANKYIVTLLQQCKEKMFDHAFEYCINYCG
jgi:hypothetical protein